MDMGGGVEEGFDLCLRSPCCIAAGPRLLLSKRAALRGQPRVLL